MPTVAALGPVLDHLIHRAGGQQLPAVPLVTWLGALLATRGVLASPRCARWIDARRLRAITQAAIQPPLELSDALILASNALLQTTDLLVHSQQHHNHNLAPLVIDRLRLNPLHAS